MNPAKYMTDKFIDTFNIQSEVGIALASFGGVVSLSIIIGVGAGLFALVFNRK